jgi:CubicO group peptidase (beta-lactamase class C family)
MSHIALAAAVTALALAPAAPARALPADTIATALGVQLDSALRAIEQRGFSGAVRIERGGTLLLEKGYGLANRERRIPFRGATVVQIGSNTKDFTLVALLRLEQRGRLNLRDSLGKYFPTAPADKRGITLQQLVDHRGGFPIGLGGDFDAVTREDFVRMALASPLRAQPGTRESYSNTGYALLAAVIEQVTGKSYDQHVRDDLLVPLGLEHTGYLLPHFDPDHVAHGYEGGRDRGSILEKAHAADGPYWNLRGNGGMVSTVSDMHTFYRALFESDRLLPTSARGDRFDPNAPVGLAGSDLVNFFVFERIPSEHVEMIIATNSAEMPAPMVRDVLASLLGIRPTRAEGGGSPAAPPAAARAPEPAVASLLRNFISAVNGGDSAIVRTFVAEHFEPSASASIEQRIERFATMHERLGDLSTKAMWLDEQGAVTVSTVSAKEGPATLLVDVTASAPHQIRSVRVMVGG